MFWGESQELWPSIINTGSNSKVQIIKSREDDDEETEPLTDQLSAAEIVQAGVATGQKSRSNLGPRR